MPVLVNVVDAEGMPSVDANCTATDKGAAPVPDAGDTASHGTLDAAVQVTVFCVPVCVTRTVCAGVWNASDVAVAMAAKFSAGRSMAIPGSTPWVIVKVFPAIVAVPLRAAEVVFFATSSVTEPVPEPLLPAETVTNEDPLTADHGQPVGAVTVTVSEPAAPVIELVAGEIAYVQLAGAPSWVMVKVCPAMASVPLRELVDVFAETT